MIDEAERGLEPYRQRLLIDGLVERSAQTFATTHSPFVLKASQDSAVWHMDRAGNLGRLDNEKLRDLLRGDAATFLARLALIVEGGHRGRLRGFTIGACPSEAPRLFWNSRADGGGNDRAIGALQAIQAAGFTFGAFVDNEGRSDGRWAAISAKAGNLCFRWSAGTTETNVINAVAPDKLQALLVDPSNDLTAYRLASLRSRLDLATGDWDAIVTKAKERSVDIKNLMIAAALGHVPEGKEEEKRRYQAHARAWFKSADGRGGRELEHKLFSLNAWQTLKSELLPFCVAVCTEVGGHNPQHL